MSLAPVWELGGSIFNTASALQGLIAAASVDDVQPQAIKVAEALGHLFWASSRRIGEGVDALGGNESIRLERFKVSIGLHSGGVPRIMRESPSLVKFFLMVTALKICHDDQEIGDILFEMFDQSSLSGKYAVSSAQLGRLASVVSGLCNSILPSDLQKNVADCITEHLGYGELYRPVESRTLARLLVSIFEQLHDGSTSSVYVSGHVHCGWLAPTLLWLLDEDACMIIHDNLVLGSPTSKVTIVVDRFPHNFSWSVKTFKEDREVTSNVHTFDKEHKTILKRIPIAMTRQLLRKHFGHTDIEKARASEASRIMIEVVTDLLLKHANIIQDTQSHRGEGKYWKERIHDDEHRKILLDQVSLNTLLCHKAQQPLSSVAESYGWPSQDQVQRVALAEATAAFVEGYETQVLSDTTSSFDYFVQGRKDIMSPEATLPDSIIDAVCSMAVSIGLDAVISCLVEQADSSAPSRSVALQKFVSGKWIEKCTEPRDGVALYVRLMNSIITPEELLNKALEHLLPGFIPSPTDLIVSYGGIVVGLACVWEPQISPHASLRLKMVSGDIRRAGMSYDRITESHPWKYCGSRADDGEGIIQKWRTPIVIPPPGQYRLECSVATSGRHIEVKHYLNVFSTNESTNARKQITWRSAALALATATLDSRVTMATQSTSLDPTKCVRVQTPHLDYGKTEGVRIVPLCSSPVLMFTAASCYQVLERHMSFGHRLLVHRSGEIQSTIAYALTILDMSKGRVRLVTIFMV